MAAAKTMSFVPEEGRKVKVTITITEKEKVLMKALADHLEVNLSQLVADNFMMSYLTHEKEIFQEFAKEYPDLVNDVLLGK